MADLLNLLERLARHEVDFVLVGGLAAVTHGSSLLTQDVDVCIRLGAENLGRLLDALGDLEPVHRMSANSLKFSHEAKTLDTFKNLYLRTRIGQIDCLGSVLGVGDFEAAHASSIPVDIGEQTIRVLSIDALIAAKSALNRDRDREAVKQLQLIKEQQERKA